MMLVCHSTLDQGKAKLYFNFTRNAMNSHVKKYLLGRILGNFWYLESYELRFSDQKAQGAIEEYINSVDGNQRGIINHEMQVMMDSINLELISLTKKWQQLFGEVGC